MSAKLQQKFVKHVLSLFVAAKSQATTMGAKDKITTAVITSHSVVTMAAIVLREDTTPSGVVTTSTVVTTVPITLATTLATAVVTTLTMAPMDTPHQVT